MTFKIELFKGKCLANGEHPVMIRLYHNTRIKRFATHVSTRPSRWNPRTCRISSLDPRYKEKNLTIESAYLQVASQTPAIIASWQSTDPAYSLPAAIDAKIKSCRCLNTSRNYFALRSFITTCLPKKNLLLSDLTPAFLEDFQRILAEKKVNAPSMIPLLLGALRGVCTFAMRKGWLQTMPSISCPTYNSVSTDRNLSPSSAAGLLAATHRAIKVDPSMLMPATKALAIFSLMIAFQGLAPVDLSRLRLCDIKEPAGIDVYLIDTARRKTGVPVRIVVWKPAVTPIIEAFAKGKNKDDFLLDCFDRKKSLTSTQEQNRLGNYYRRLQKFLPECEGRKLTFYFARHAYCNMVDALDLPHHQIRKLVGHAKGVLERNYLRPLTFDEQAEISCKLLTPLLPS